MLKNGFSLLIALLLHQFSHAQLTPEITSWILNTNGDTGYDGIPTNVQLVQYSDNQVYVSATCIPGYDIGPWAGNPNIPANQNFVFKLTRHPAENTGTLTNVGLGHVGVWTNGVSIFNPKDGMSYNNQGVWNRNALYYEGASFDDCLGHPAPNGEYHHHVNPTCLYDDSDSTHHSPVIGYAFDGFPVYGAYGYSNTDGTGNIKRMRSSYVLTSNTTRTNGPAMNATYPAGCFVEDYIFTSGAGDLDIHNGRFCITPEYPNGTYAYFATLDETLYPVYPFVLGPTYYGTIQSGNTGPGGGHNMITEPVTIYVLTGIDYQSTPIAFSCYPNPTSGYLNIFITPGESNNLLLTITNEIGQTVYKQPDVQPTVEYRFDFSSFSEGLYFLTLTSSTQSSTQKIFIKK